MSIQRVDAESGRTYTLTLPSGEVVTWPSVTTILSVLNKPYLVPWAAKEAVEYVRANLPLDRPVSAKELDTLLLAAKNQHNWIKEEAGLIGSQAHALVEGFLRTGELPNLTEVGLDPRVRMGVEKYLNWWEERGLEPIATETVVYHEEARFAGTLDCVAVDRRDKIVLLDLKTSRHYSTEYGLQVVAYKYAYELMTESLVDDCYVVRVGKDDAAIEVTEIPSARHPFLFHCFRAARQCFQWQVAERELAKSLPAERREARKAAKETAAPAANGKSKTKRLTPKQQAQLARPVC